MIQRIQTLYLFMTTMLPLLFLKFRLLTFIGIDDTRFSVRFSGLYSADADGFLSLIRHLVPVSVLIILIPALSLVTLFLFRKRKLQLRLTLLIIVLAAGLILAEIIYSIIIIREYRSEIIPGFMMSVPLFILIFSVLAYRRIKRDEDLVRSYDRLR